MRERKGGDVGTGIDAGVKLCIEACRSRKCMGGQKSV
jgi:hypothetical protein